MIVVIDGLGGGLGAQIITQIREELSLDIQVLALGTNAVATERMMKAKANQGATGENAIRVSIRKARVIVASLSVVIPNAMLGEITPLMAEAIADSPASKVFLPIVSSDISLIGIEEKPLRKQITTAIQVLREKMVDS